MSPVPSACAAPTVLVWQGLKSFQKHRKVRRRPRICRALFLRSRCSQPSDQEATTSFLRGVRVYACLGCSQTNDSPEEVHRFCTDPKERAGSCAGSSLEDRERVLETRIELAGVDVALRLLSRGPDRVPMCASVGPKSLRTLFFTPSAAPLSHTLAASVSESRTRTL